ncbi:MAG: flavodoxin [Candidatus Lokiarchaeota archaeon]|nr:flavodoxin [Candidatus Lokiarchaeota archaeon]MBD3199376.1 flavodoxin [Candidatus Lokiarchaeota archaeon]
MKIILVLYSYHHKNTEKIAKVIGKVLNAEIRDPHNLSPEDLEPYDFLGFGSGIYSAKLHDSIFNLVDNLPQTTKKTFIFSTAALTSKKKMDKDHSLLRENLESKGYSIIGEFSCKGFNTNSFMKYLGGMNKGRPNEEDLQNAKNFALKLKEKMD